MSLSDILFRDGMFVDSIRDLFSLLMVVANTVFRNGLLRVRRMPGIYFTQNAGNER